MREFILVQPKTAVIEFIRPSGLTKSGLFVLDHDNVKDQAGNDFSLMVRVKQRHQDCSEIQVGEVYQVLNPYNYSKMPLDGKDFFVMHEDNFILHLEGFDEDGELLSDEFEDAGYPVCAKA